MLVSLRNALCLTLLLAPGCGLARQMTSPQLRTLVREYGAGTVPDRDREIAFQTEPLTDDDFARMFPVLKGYGRVDDLNFHRHPQLTDASVSLLLQFRSLRRLALLDTGITPRGMQRLAQLPELRELSIDGGRFPAEELVDLRAALPKVHIDEHPGFAWDREAALRATSKPAATAPSTAPARPY